MSQKPLVEVKNLSVSFPVSGGIMGRKVAEVKAVDDISFSIGKSEIVGLVGESGCGKTTVGRAMINILKYIIYIIYILVFGKKLKSLTVKPF